MRRREFLTTAAAATLCGDLATSWPSARAADAETRSSCRTYASPEEAAKSPRETELFVTALRVGIDERGPDYLATVDVDPRSSTYSQVVSRLVMPEVGDELHHFGWNACSSCHGQSDKMRRYLIVPGLRSSRIHIVDAAEARTLKMVKVIQGTDIAAKTNLSAPHTVHCLPGGQIMLSM
ncbi:MAG TPA: selenium-binding protein SBP56-related protein, partial [Pirellulales bacterium]|nr:selenium-binding protein SBP56-related protein [Pirellulales bacterium]